MFETAFIVRVPEAEAYVADLRRRFDPSVHLGVPAHITILVPFMAPDRITDKVLSGIRSALSSFSSFAFSLADVRCFPTTTYLAPEPADRFVALTKSLALAFPDFPPFRGEHASLVPHLTVANGNAGDAKIAMAELERVMQASGPVRSFCASVALLENSSGNWREMHMFELAGHSG